MSFQTSNQSDDVMSEINMTPMVDVMLVLLIIFIVAMPVMQHMVKINLPEAAAQPQVASTGQDIRVEINAEGSVSWNGDLVAADQLPQFVSEVAATHPEKPLVHVLADKTTPYEYVAKVMALLQRSGFSKVGLMTSPQ